MKSKTLLDDFIFNASPDNVAKANISIRMGFLRKVYGILACQFTLTFVVGVLFYIIPQSRAYVIANRWHLDSALILSVVSMLGLYYKRRESPINLIFLAVFTLCQSYVIGAITVFYQTSTVIKSLAVTMGTFVGLSMYAMQTKKDFSKWAQTLFAGMWVLFIGGLIQMFYPISGLEFGLSILGSLVFCMYIVYDTQILMTKLSAEEYIMAAISLYMDAINLFLYVLRLLRSSERNKD